MFLFILQMMFMLLKITGGSEILIPAVNDYIESFDPEKKILISEAGERNLRR